MPAFDRPILLENPVKHYAWGGSAAIPDLLGIDNPGAEPFAEWWISAHPQAPSLALLPSGKVPLDQLVAAYPEPILGISVAQRFERTLPFLWKILSAERPLSLQCHPDSTQARAGFAREEAAGIARDARTRCYRDPHAKPELVVALSRFSALKGFRQPQDIAAAFAHLPHPGIEAAVSGLESRQDLRGFFSSLLALNAGTAEQLVSAVAAAAGGLVAELAARYPADVAALAPLFLHQIELEPGQGLFLPAGELHAYLGGTALEIMGNSDNVLRGGLTDKHVDPAELLVTLGFSPSPPEVLRPTDEPLAIYATPADSFLLGRATSERKLARRQRHDVDILLCLGGRVMVNTAAAELVLERGQSALMPACLGDYEVCGSSELWLATVPPPEL